MTTSSTLSEAQVERIREAMVPTTPVLGSPGTGVLRGALARDIIKQARELVERLAGVSRRKQELQRLIAAEEGAQRKAYVVRDRIAADLVGAEATLANARDAVANAYVNGTTPDLDAVTKAAAAVEGLTEAVRRAQLESWRVAANLPSYRNELGQLELAEQHQANRASEAEQMLRQVDPAEAAAVLTRMPSGRTTTTPDELQPESESWEGLAPEPDAREWAKFDIEAELRARDAADAKKKRSK